jgi:hypothetical protein
LKSHLAIAIDKTYPKGRKIAIKETKLADFGIADFFQRKPIP